MTYMLCCTKKIQNHCKILHRTLTILAKKCDASANSACCKNKLGEFNFQHKDFQLYSNKKAPG